MTSPGAYVALMYRRYRYLYGAPEDALAPLAINNRKNGALNPIAVMRTPIRHEEYMAARYIAENALGWSLPYEPEYAFTQSYVRGFAPNFGTGNVIGPVAQAWLAK